MAYKSKKDALNYSKKHYQENKQKYLDRNRTRVKRFREIILKAKAVPCVDCGQEYPYYVMDFDHVQGKKFNIGDVSKIPSEKALWEEIVKCDIVCANCHRIRTHAPVA